ncbi:hypothetical protein, partial [Streptomyces rimosus]
PLRPPTRRRTPLQPHHRLTACRVIDEAVGPDAYIVTDAGLRRLCGDPHRSSSRHAARYVVCGGNGPPGRQAPVTIGVRVALNALGRRDTTVVTLVPVRELPRATDALAFAALHEVPFVLVAVGPDAPQRQAVAGADAGVRLLGAPGGRPRRPALSGHLGP